ncbi:hypothetical protein B0H14DRAFT_2643547 [Mycena olivaceomarginata]|nr:hypothetical protein B0H14DRAFT_2643547 [Mycena olivaceomarginata]
MSFNHIEPTVFRDTILATKDWTEFLPKFCQARVEDTGDTHLLNSLTSATSINTNFALDMKDGYTWLTDCNSTDHSGHVALFNTSGFVTDLCLTVVNLVSDFMLGSGPNITPLPTSVTLGGLCGGITATTRVMTPAEHNIFSVVDIPAQLDVQGYVKAWANGGVGRERFMYTADNDIEVMNLVGLENDSDGSIPLNSTSTYWQFDNHIPRSMIQPRNLVEILVSFRVAPFAKGVKKSLCHVDEEAAAVHSAGGSSSGQLLGKRMLPAPFARSTRPRMDVDQLGNGVQKLNVDSH